MNNTINLGDFIKVYDNTLTDSFCKSVCVKMEDDDRKKLGVMDRDKKVDITRKTSLDLHISSKSDWKYEDGVFLDSLTKYHKKYRDDLEATTGSSYGDYASSDDHFSDTGYQVKMYEPDGFYTWHDDYMIDAYAGVRVLTYIWYLNDDFDEGETEFYDGTIIKPKRGRILFFPATWLYVHRGRTVKNNKKFIATGWFFHQHPYTKECLDTCRNKVF
tara:strand:- start:61 stop:708 length:648 start_codon:yes stop_codon:yes gene_type:complete